MPTGPPVLYLAQHAEAKAEQEDPARPLSDRGREEVARVARAAARGSASISAIYHSGKLRAQQTAEIFAQVLSPRGGVGPMDGLAPNDDPAIIQRALRGIGPSALLVGHLPHLSRLTSLLVTGDSTPEVVAFRMGGLVRLDGSPDGGWRVSWILTPEVAG